MDKQMKVKINITIDESLLKDIQLKAKTEKRNISNTINYILDNFFNKKENNK